MREGVRGAITGTVVDIDEARGILTLEPQDDKTTHLAISTDSISTQYNGFGGVINGSPEIFNGSPGFANIRVGDRLDIRGIGRGNGFLGADQITLLGRVVPAPQTGVGTTRPTNTISTPTVGGNSSVNVYGRVEGVIRQVNSADGRIAIETDRREIVTVRGTSSTPVYYQNSTYHLSDLEVGDTIRVEPDANATTRNGEVRVRSIEVLRSVQEGPAPGGRIAQITGRITRVERSANALRIDTGRGEARVDLSSAYDSANRRVRAADFQAGDRVIVNGSYGPTGDLFVASTIRTAFDDNNVPDTQPGGSEPAEFATVTIYATVTQTLDNSPQLGLRDTQSTRMLRLNALDDFVVRTKAGGYITADKLKIGDAITVKAYRSADGDYIAQTIRLR